MYNFTFDQEYLLKAYWLPGSGLGSSHIDKTTDQMPIRHYNKVIVIGGLWKKVLKEKIHEKQ